MKKLLIIPMLLVCFVSMGQGFLSSVEDDYPPSASRIFDWKNGRETILRIADVDFGDKMTWDDAVNACASLGPGWRLPNKEELQLLYDNRDLIFRNRDDDNGYWGSDEEGDQAWSLSTWGGSKGYYYPKSGTARVRAVTTLGIENPLPGVIGFSIGQTYSESIIGQPISLGSFEIAQFDFQNCLLHGNVADALASLGPGWRLPTYDELYFINQYMAERIKVQNMAERIKVQISDDSGFGLVMGNFNHGDMNDDSFYYFWELLSAPPMDSNLYMNAAKNKMGWGLEQLPANWSCGYVRAIRDI